MYLALDIETGGLDPVTTSLLTAHFAIVDDEFNILDEHGFALKHDIYHVTGGALNVNHISIEEHDKIAQPLDTVVNNLNHFLRKHALIFKGHNAEGDPMHDEIQLIPLGHNVAFDVRSLQHTLKQVQWKFVSYRVMDTQVAARFLQICGKLPLENKCSLRALAEYFKIEDKEAHTARGDVLVTIEVMKKLKALGVG